MGKKKRWYDYTFKEALEWYHNLLPPFIIILIYLAAIVGIMLAISALTGIDFSYSDDAPDPYPLGTVRAVSSQSLLLLF